MDKSVIKTILQWLGIVRKQPPEPPYIPPAIRYDRLGEFPRCL